MIGGGGRLVLGGGSGIGALLGASSQSSNVAVSLSAAVKSQTTIDVGDASGTLETVPIYGKRRSIVLTRSGRRQRRRERRSRTGDIGPIARGGCRSWPECAKKGRKVTPCVDGIGLWSGLGKQSNRNQRAKRQNNRTLQIEPLECRQLLSVAPPAYTGPSDPDIAAFLTSYTPNPHPTGDPPTSTAQMIPLAAYTPPPADIPDPFPQLAIGLQQIDCSIENNPQARPSFWGETTSNGGDVYKLHLCDNGMLVEWWTINWGDGSDPQTVSTRQSFALPIVNVPWVTHQYSGSPNQYAITVTASAGMDGTFTGGTGDPGTLDQSFDPITRNALAISHGGVRNPEWANQIGNFGQQTTNFESNTGLDQAAAVALDNGNILTVGTTASGQFGLTRYAVDPGQADDGNPDPTFGTDGQVTTTFSLGNRHGKGGRRGLRPRIYCRSRHRCGRRRQ